MYTMIDWPAMCTQSWFDMYICLKKQRVHLLQIFTLITPWSLWPFSSVQLSKRRTVCKIVKYKMRRWGWFFLEVSHVKVLLWMNLNFGGVPCESAMVDEFLDSYSLVYGGGWVFYIAFAVDCVSAIVFVIVANNSSVVVAVVYTTTKSLRRYTLTYFKR